MPAKRLYPKPISNAGMFNVRYPEIIQRNTILEVSKWTLTRSVPSSVNIIPNRVVSRPANIGSIVRVFFVAIVKVTPGPLARLYNPNALTTVPRIIDIVADACSRFKYRVLNCMVLVAFLRIKGIFFIFSVNSIFSVVCGLQRK